MPVSRPLSAVLDTIERSGKLSLRTRDARAALPSVSDEALRHALYLQHLRGRVIRLSYDSDYWLIVPLQHAAPGVPPLAAWLDRYMSKISRAPYYATLLSAAKTYGALPYAVTATQVMVPERRRPITVGRCKVTFYTCPTIERMPTRWHETPDGCFKVGTPELTALELVQREDRIGGMVRVREILRGLWSSCTTQGLIEALEALQDVPTAQRFGVLLAMESRNDLTSSLVKWLRNKPLRIVSFKRGLTRSTALDIDARFKVRLPIDAEKANT